MVKNLCILNLNGGHICYFWEWDWKWTGMAWSPVCTADFHGDTTTQTCALLPTGEQANCSGGDQGSGQSNATDHDWASSKV